MRDHVPADGPLGGRVDSAGPRRFALFRGFYDIFSGGPCLSAETGPVVRPGSAPHRAAQRHMSAATAKSCTLGQVLALPGLVPAAGSAALARPVRAVGAPRSDRGGPGP